MKEKKWKYENDTRDYVGRLNDKKKSGQEWLRKCTSIKEKINLMKC